MIRVKGLSRRFVTERGAVQAVNDISFEVAEGSFYTLLGPSGCGKTTTLRCIAGLERPDAGEVTIGGVTVSSSERGIFVQPERRDIGMVFQSYAIWPHLTVFENAAFPLRVGKTRYSLTEIRAKVRRALEIVRLSGLEDRPAPQLSGGQQQRLALARALVHEPRLLLLDEPLSNLDARLRENMRIELRELQRQLGITTLYVTHDQLEALSMSSVIAVMHDGRIVQEGSPIEIYEKPYSRTVADFIGTINIVPGRLADRNAEGEACFIESPVGVLRGYCNAGISKGSPVLVCVRPENVRFHTERPQNASNVVEGTVRVATYYGEYLNCQVRVENEVIQARRHPSFAVREGDKVFVELPPASCIVLPSDEPTVEE